MSVQNQGKTTTIMKLRLLFHEYYSAKPKSIDTPERIHQREFAIQAWEYNWRCREQTGKDESGKVTQQFRADALFLVQVACPLELLVRKALLGLGARQRGVRGSQQGLV